jgi:hypothetical protein
VVANYYQLLPSYDQTLSITESDLIALDLIDFAD